MFLAPPAPSGTTVVFYLFTLCACCWSSVNKCIQECEKDCVCLSPGQGLIISLNTKPFCQFNDSPDSLALSQHNIKPLPPINALHLPNKLQWTEPRRTLGQRISAMHTEPRLHPSQHFSIGFLQKVLFNFIWQH